MVVIDCFYFHTIRFNFVPLATRIDCENLNATVLWFMALLHCFYLKPHPCTRYMRIGLNGNP